MATKPRSKERVKADTEALLRLFAEGGTLADLYKLSDDELEALYAFGLGHYQQAKYADALKIFAQLVAMSHGEPRYLNGLAAAHQMLGQHGRAVHYYGLAQLLDPTDPVPTFHAANSLLALGWVDDARDALEMVIQQAEGDRRHAALYDRSSAMLNLVSRRTAEATAV